MTAAPPPLIGRDRERDLLRAALADAAGRGRLLLITGEPGLGKTRLCEELELAARAAGVPVRWGHGRRDHGAAAYGPWHPLAGPALADLAGLSGGPDDAAHRFRLGDAVVAHLRQAARPPPLVLVLEDLHAWDLPSLRLLQLVADQLRALPVLVVGTYRLAELRADPALSRALAGLGRGATTLALRGLDPPEIGAVMDHAAGVALPAAIVAALYERTAGNPLFARELARYLVSQGDTSPARAAQVAATMPQAIADVILGRLAQLAPAAVDVLTIAAVGGLDLDLAIVATVTGRTEADCIAVLDASVGAGLLVERRDGRLGFAHALIRDAVYRSAPLARRSALHLAFADALEARDAGAPRYAVLAHHHRLARAPDPRRHVHYERLAGHDAAAHLAFDSAALHFERALAALDSDRDTALVDELQRALAAARRALAPAPVPTPTPEVVVAPAPAPAPIVAAPAPPAPAPAPTAVLLTLDGELWRLDGGAAPLWLPDSRGMRDLAELVRAPGREVHVSQLAALHTADDLPADGDAGALLDAQARAAYRARLDALEDTIADAERDGATDRARAARAEAAYLVAELARATGLGGRERRSGNQAERLRQSVGKRLRDAIRKIASHDPALGAHLERAVRTGLFCSYDPAAAPPVSAGPRP